MAEIKRKIIKLLELSAAFCGNMITLLKLVFCVYQILGKDFL